MTLFFNWLGLHYFLAHLICQLAPRFQQILVRAAPSAAGSDIVDISSSPSWPSELCLQSCITGIQCGVCQGYSLAEMSGCETNSCFCEQGNLEIAYENLIVCRAYNCYYYNIPVYSDPYTLLVGYCKWVGMPSTPTSTANAAQLTSSATRYVNPASSTISDPNGPSTSAANTDSGPLSRSDKIALGVGLGVGIPSAIAAIIYIWKECLT